MIKVKKREIKVTDRVYNALCCLVLDDGKDYNTLTIIDICEKANVCRNSFYRNYKSKEEIITTKFFECYAPNKNFVAVSFTDQKSFLKALLSDVKENKRLFKLFYISNPFLYYQYISKHIIASNHITEDVNRTEYYNISCKSWLFLGVMTDWIQNNCDISTIELTNIICNWIK